MKTAQDNIVLIHLITSVLTDALAVGFAERLYGAVWIWMENK